MYPSWKISIARLPGMPRIAKLSVLKRSGSVRKGSRTARPKANSMRRRTVRHMTYYDQLVREMGKSMDRHPQSTMVMDYGSRKIVAMGANTAKISQKVKTRKADGSISIVFRRPKENAIWILPGK